MRGKTKKKQNQSFKINHHPWPRLSTLYLNVICSSFVMNVIFFYGSLLCMTPLFAPLSKVSHYYGNLTNEISVSQQPVANKRPVVCRKTQCLFKSNKEVWREIIKKNCCFALALFSTRPHFQEKELGQRAITYQFLIKIGGRVHEQVEIRRPEYWNTEEDKRLE